jgi:hypothetical protein
MKTKQMKVLGLSVALGLVSLSAHAGVVDSAGTWQGKGASFDLSGTETGQFQIDLTNIALDTHTIDTEGKITFPNGQVKNFSQKMKDSGKGFTIESDEGKGGGNCFGEGLCESYIVSADGSAVAVTTVLDGNNSLRTLITMLDSNGKAVQFIREKMAKLD